jgi:hypothetical protein
MSKGAMQENEPNKKMKNEFEIKTLRKRAVVSMTDCSSLSGCFFVSPNSSRHEGPETIYELLTGDRNYLPFDWDGEGVVLLQRGSIATVRLAEKEINRYTPFQKKLRTRISFLSGETLEGNVFSDHPKAYLRLSDFLNLSNNFFYIQVEDDDCLVNTLCVKFLRHVQ